MAHNVTTSDVAARWRALTADEATRAEALLADALASTDALAPGADEGIVRQVACSMVVRAMSAGADAPLGASQAQWTAGSYSGSVSFSNPSGDLYMTQQEKSLLGVGTGRIASVSLLGGD